VTVQQALEQSGIDPREARLFLSAATGFSEASVLAHTERQLSADAARRFLRFAERRRAGDPVAYILGRKEFYGLELAVNPAVLIPRPETELLVDLALASPFTAAADLGTGSGAIALALKKNQPAARIVATDASAAALVVAQRNAVRHNLEIDWRHGRWLAPLAAERFDLIVSNPPYVAAGDPHLADLGHEPVDALVSGTDGLDAIREIVRAAPDCLSSGGRLLLEHGFAQAPQVRALLAGAGLRNVRSWTDLAGIERVTGAVK
jgi:release factor glutamine methyltransferase